VNALRNEEGYNMKEFRIYADLLEAGKLTGLNFDYEECLINEHEKFFEKIDRRA